MSNHPDALGLRTGDRIRVRSRDEILATLDENARLDGLPFQPEMFAHCGLEYRVRAVAHKTCDTINNSGGRRMRDTVHLEGLRCDGSAHGGCQAQCLMFWKEAWLHRVEAAAVPAQTSAALRCNEARVHEAARTAQTRDSPSPVWVCQTTALLDATQPLAWWDVRQFVRDVTTGNHRVRDVLQMIAFAAFRQLLALGVGHRVLISAYDAFQRLRGGKPYPQSSGFIAKGQPTPTGTLDLQVGEWVRIRPIEEIRTTLTTAGFNRGMWFDQEMVRYCGGTHRVELRVDRIIDERTGQMTIMKSPCIQLEDVYCRARCTGGRLGCPRSINTYWRELWLERAAAPSDRPDPGVAKS
jgi:hypothetical protein